MFRSVDFVEFKGIRKCEKPIELAKFTLIVGPNNAGKSSVLEGLFFLPIPWSPYKLPFYGKSKLEFFDEIHGGHASLVYRYSGEASVNVNLEGKNVKLKLTPSGDFEVIIEGRIGITSSMGQEIARVAQALRGASTSENYDELLRYTVYIPNNSQFTLKLKEALMQHWQTVSKTNAHVRAVRNLVGRVVEDKFTEVLVSFSDLVVRKEIPEGGTFYVKLEDLGDGVKRVLPAFLWVEAVRPKVVLWDDLEASSHPALVGALLEWLMGGDWQVIATTHSLDVLNSFVELEPEAGRVIQLWKSADDTLRWKSLTVEDVEKLLESGADIRKLFRW